MDKGQANVILNLCNWQNGLSLGLLSVRLETFRNKYTDARGHSYRVVKVPHQSMQTQLSYQHDTYSLSSLYYII